MPFFGSVWASVRLFVRGRTFSMGPESQKITAMSVFLLYIYKNVPNSTIIGQIIALLDRKA